MSKTMRAGFFTVLATTALMICSAPARADCTGPAGVGGDLLFNSASRMMQYCNSQMWVQIGPGPRGGSGCTTPSGAPGAIMFNSASRVMQHCNGQEWAPWGVIGGVGTSTGSCTSPTGVTGAILFNSDYRLMQYCDGGTWEMAGQQLPSLTMDFVNNKYTILGTSYSSYSSFATAIGATFTRSSTATYFDSTGTMQTAAANTPRFDYDPSTNRARGLLMEESRTNMLLQSQAMNTASWFKGAVSVTADQAIAPDGTMTADKVAANGGNYGYWGQDPSWTAGQRVSRSIYVKPGTGNYILFEVKASNALTYVAFILSGAGRITNNSSGTSAWIQYVGNGWYRISASRTFSAASNSQNEFGVIYINGPGAAAVGEYAYFWGGQAEIGAFPTSYIPTTTAAVTRSEDMLTMPLGSWFNPSIGSMMSQGIIPYTGSASWPGLFSFDDGTSANAMHVIMNDNTHQAGLEVWNAGNCVYCNGYGTYTGGNVLSLALSYSAANTFGATDGTPDGTVTPISVPTVSVLRIGSDRGDGQTLNGWVQSFGYYPTTMSTTLLGKKTQH